ncbi:MAG TPA: hypothetical protein DDZ89_04525 [Clostridiales bacterium]|nr:hypothetical protein [Clostridiales bacterium]
MNYIEQLIDVLEKQKNLHIFMLELSEKKTQVIIHNDVKELDYIVKQEQTWLEELEECEKTREDLCVSIAHNLKLDPTTIDIKQVLAQTPPELQDKLSLHVKELQSVLKKQKDLNDLNSKLLNNNLKYINEVVNKIVMGETEQDTYNHSGDRALVQKRNIIDTTV